MPKYKCTNKKCDRFNKELLIVKVSYKYDKKTGRMVSDDIQCPECGLEMKDIPQELDLSSIQLNKTSMLSMEQKKDLLRARSRDLSIPTNKVLKERKDAIDKGEIKV